jgi:hypothetical protein
MSDLERVAEALLKTQGQVLDLAITDKALIEQNEQLRTLVIALEARLAAVERTVVLQITMKQQIEHLRFLVNELQSRDRGIGRSP